MSYYIFLHMLLVMWRKHRSRVCDPHSHDIACNFNEIFALGILMACSHCIAVSLDSIMLITSPSMKRNTSACNLCGATAVGAVDSVPGIFLAALFRPRVPEPALSVLAFHLDIVRCIIGRRSGSLP